MLSSRSRSNEPTCLSSIACRKLLFKKLERKRAGGRSGGRASSVVSGFFVLRSTAVPSVRLVRSVVPGVEFGKESGTSLGGSDTGAAGVGAEA